MTQTTGQGFGEADVEAWATSPEVFSKFDEDDKTKILAILDHMRIGKPGERASFPAEDVDNFISGLDPSLKSAATEHLKTFRQQNRP